MNYHKNSFSMLKDILVTFIWRQIVLVLEKYYIYRVFRKVSKKSIAFPPKDYCDCELIILKIYGVQNDVYLPV